MIVKCVTLMEWGVNCYLVGDEATRRAAVIDPGAEPERILEEARRNELQIELILNTHGHGDHIGANGAIQVATGAPIAIGRKDAPFLSDPNLNLSTLLAATPFVSPPASRLLDGGDEVALGELRLRVISTPGHTPGGICLVGPEAIFSGDTLFAGTVGRTDFPLCDHQALLQSLDKLMDLPDDLVVYPGHGPFSTIGDERDTNPFMSG